MSGQTIRQKYMRLFAGMRRYTSFEGRLVVASYLFQIVLAIAAGHVAIAYLEGVQQYALVGFFMIFVGTRFRGLNNIVHECSHATFVEDREENWRLGSLCASSVLSCFKDYRAEHLTHHQHLGDYEHDLDLQGIEDLKLHEPLTAKTLLRHVVTPFIGRHLPYYLGANLSSKDGIGYLVYKYALIAAAFVYLAIEPITALLMIFVPFVLIYSALNYWTDCMDHAGLVASEDELDASRNILAPVPVRWFLFPRSDCFHLVHHLFPQIPARHLKTAHRTLAADPIYSSRKNATGLWRKQSGVRAAAAYPAE